MGSARVTDIARLHIINDRRHVSLSLRKPVGLRWGAPHPIRQDLDLTIVSKCIQYAILTKKHHEIAH